VADERVQVDESIMRSWAEVALHIRMVDKLVHSVTVPVPGSPFALTDDLYPSESSSQWAREPLRSAVDHLTTWANHTVPLTQYPGQVVTHHGFRWTFTLVRAALEGAAQSMWLTQAKNTHECVARLVRAVRDDVGQEIKAWSALDRSTTGLEARALRHAQAADEFAEWGKPVATLPAMVSLLRAGAAHEGLDPSRLEAMWRVCSAAAHGKAWAVHELQIVRDQREWRPGQYHLTAYPDSRKLTQMLEDTTEFLNLAAIRYLLRMGADVTRELQAATIAAASETPSTDGGAMVREKRRKFEEEYGITP
jgi:hypothetical protein